MSQVRQFSSTSIFRSFGHFFLILMLSGLLTSCESRRTIVNGLDEKEANEILVFLSNRGIDANKIPALVEGAGSNRVALWNISVQSTQANEAMALLNQVGLPRRRGQNLLGIFSNVGLVPSGMEQKIRYQAGLAEQIASTIRRIDGVLEADVQISFPEEDPLNPAAQKQKITASVFIKHSGVLDDPNAHLMTRIKRLVSGSVNGLDFDRVTVIGDRARFGDAPLNMLGLSGEEDRPFVHVWSMIVAKDSLTRFRVIFFSFTLLLMLLILSLIWILWKLMPLINKIGGMKKLFTIQPLDLTPLTAETTKSNESKEDANSENKDDSESTQGGAS